MIRMNKVEKHYPGFDLNLDMEVQKGYITGLIGVNGSGKTTAFRLLTGLMQADGGEAILLNENAWALPVEVKRKIGVVFADSGFQPEFTITNIRAMLKTFYPDFNSNQFDELCRKFDLPMKQKIGGFSTGMKARLKIISALSHSPEVLILDEPTSGLDVIARNEILALLQEYMEVPGRTVLISSHIASDLEQICDDFWMISKGKTVLHETVDALQNEYGLLMLNEREREQTDLQAVVKEIHKQGRWEILVSDRQYYRDNYPNLKVDKGTIDDLLMIMEEKS